MDWNWSGAVEDEHRLIGYAQLLRLAQSGADLQPLIARLMERAKRGERAADALMDLSWIFLLAQQPEMAVTTQSLALKLQQTYKLQPRTDASACAWWPCSPRETISPAHRSIFCSKVRMSR